MEAISKDIGEKIVLVSTKPTYLLMKSTSQGHVPKYIKEIRTPFLDNEKLGDWSEELTAICILELNNELENFNLNSLGLARSPKTDPILTEIIGRPISRKFLHYAACYFFGSWNNALLSLGLEPIRASCNRFWSKKKITSGIKGLYKKGHPLTVKSIWRDRSRSTSSILFKYFGRKTTGSALYDAARRYFGSWDKALTSAAINSQIVKEKPFWTGDKVIIAIKSLHKRGFSLNSASIQKDKSRKFKNAIKEELGKSKPGISLYGGAYRFFGSWDKALRAAGFNSMNIRKINFAWKKNSISRILHILYELEIPINSSSIRRDTSEETSSIIYDFTGQNFSAPKLFRLGNNMFGTWDSALKNSGLRLSEIRRNGSPCENNSQKIIEYLRLFKMKEYELNRSSVLRYSHFMKILMEDNFGKAISGMSLLKAASNIFGTWDDALWEAGLDPSIIRKRSRANSYALPIITTQVEDVIVDGERRYSRFLGTPSKSPEKIMIEKENKKKFSNILSKSSEEETNLIDKILDVISQIHHYKNQDDLIKYLCMYLKDKSISESEIKELFTSLANRYVNEL
ncbi:MAG: hypothetical protein OXB88_05430 [Bacteriovoracales bacterium]|nr:hypothetical protein [Bacteriovoracales bacterium]